MLLNFRNDSCLILDRYIKWQQITSGHYSLLLTNMLLWGWKIIKNIVTLWSFRKNLLEWRKGRRMRNYIGNLLMHQKRNWYLWFEVFPDKKFLDLIKVCDSCSVCLRFRRPLQPVVRFALGSRINVTVCLNLKEHGYNQYWVLHLIGTSIRYSVARLIKTPKSEEIICYIFLMGISYFRTQDGFWLPIGRNLIMKVTNRWI